MDCSRRAAVVRAASALAALAAARWAAAASGEARAWTTPWFGGPRPTRRALRKGRDVCRATCRASGDPVEWIPVEDGPTVEAADAATVLPVFPLNVVEWVGSEMSINVIEPAYRKMYDDILVSGARRFLMPFAPCVPGFPRGRVRFPEMPVEDRRLHAVGALLYLEDIKEVSEQTDGVVKYQARHTVVGRARMTRLLNPSAMYKQNEEGWKVDYLRAEAELLDEPDDQGLAGEGAESLGTAWETLRQMAEEAGEPRMESESVIKQVIADSSTWQLAELWHKLQMVLHAFRQRSRVLSEVKDWVRSQRDLGGLPPDLPDELAAARLGLPRELTEALARSQQPEAMELGTDWWEPYLRLQAITAPAGQGASGARGARLLQMAEEEIRVARARASLRQALE